MTSTISKKAILPLSAMVCITAMAERVIVSNPLPTPRSEVVAVDFGRPCCVASGCSFVALTEKGDSLQTQITHDGKLLIPVTVGPSATASYEIVKAPSPASAYPKAFAAVYPERDDDLSWENDLVGFRAYGPAKQAKGERLYGYDLWLKRATDRLTVPKLYADDINPANWVTVDSLRRIDNALAEDFIKTFSYHVDHGYGMDCYAVGPTLGACTAALTDTKGGAISYPWAYESAEILDNGPLRVTMRLTYPERVIGRDTVRESRLISLDAGERLNRTEVTFSGAGADHDVVTGIVLHDDAATLQSPGMIAYTDPTQGPDNGRIMLGAVSPEGFAATEVVEQDGFRQLVGRSPMVPEQAFSYRWGFAWDRTDIKDMKEWLAYLESLIDRMKNPLEVKIEK